MFAVVRTGGKQFRVTADDVIKVEKLPGVAGDIVTLRDVLMLTGDAGPEIGQPTVAGASVAAVILEQARDDKIIVFKKRRRKNYRRKKGHRQSMTVLRVREILTGGAMPSLEAVAAPVASAAKRDDVALIGGVGPKLKEKLASVGITTLTQIAALDAAAVAALDEKLDLRGRPVRDEWVEQAKELLAGKPPRAKADQETAAKED